MTSTAVSTGYDVVRRQPLAGLDGALESALRSAMALVPALSGQRIPVVRLSGGGRSVLVAGEHPATAFVCRAVVGSEPAREMLRRVSPWRLPAVLQSLAGDVDLVIARAPRVLAERLYPETWLRLPEAVNARLRVPEPGAAVHWPRKASYNVCRVRKGGFDWQVSTRAADFDHFFDTMLVPYATARHGDNVLVPSRRAMHRRFRRGGILWIEQGGERTAGVLAEIDGDMLRLWALGTRGGSEEPARAGALSAAYIFALDYARSLGLRWCDLGGGPPSPTDGSMRHKLSWGAEVCTRPESRHDLLLHWPAGVGAGTEFLADTPLFVHDGGGLSPLTSGSGSDNAVLARRYAPTGARRVCVLGGDAADNGDAGPAGLPVARIADGWRGNPLYQSTGR